ncbi:GyrI-like domain-containing protein [Shewanella intestini]|uniref:AraC family transcriptional regulator n=1 Tax=Shewanella intestini TaxID=2017544 RepID=A0ABS5I5G4_9GAMM|nr:MULTISPECIES: AraC family transcriptional regulator [Shewanella]MBR9729274.1 AraC family transcriptional regulator [Shewanella intestini]MRG35419.1 hypothetical protein [Shewanella sp. XMDDZSB0408]
MTLLKNFEIALDYLEQNLEKPLDIDLLSQLTSIPLQQFEVAFSALFHTNIDSYFTILKMLDCAQKLAFETRVSIEDISHQAGFGQSMEFEQAFFNAIGQTVYDFRVKPDWGNFFSRQQPLNTLAKGLNNVQDFSNDIQIIEFRSQRLIAIRHQGEKQYLSQTINALTAWQEHHHINHQMSRSFHLMKSLDTEPNSNVDVEITAVLNDAQYDALTASIAASEHFYVTTLPKCKMLQLPHRGCDIGLEDKIKFLYGVYLEREGYQLADIPLVIERCGINQDKKMVSTILLAVN